VDGAVAFTGGLNIADEYRAWCDQMVEVRGAAVAEVSKVFRQIWERGGTGFFRRSLPFYSLHLAKRIIEAPFTRQPVFPAILPAAPQAFPFYGAALPVTSVRVVRQSPENLRSNMLNMFEYAIACAQKNVYLASPYFVPPPRLLNALKAAAQRGVTVKILLQGKTDEAIMMPLARASVQELETCGVQIYAYEQKIWHGKFMTIDGKWTTIGSANADMRSAFLNYEVNLAISSENFAATMEGLFHAYIATAPRWQTFFADLPPPPRYLQFLRNHF
jgi:cardiolipin synthase